MTGLAAALVGVAMLAAWSGGWRIEVFGIDVSVRAVWRPLAVAVALLTAHALRRRGGSFTASELSTNAARVIAGGLLVAGILGWITYLSPYAGGSDSYGYVSAAQRIRSGSLVQHEPLADVLPSELAVAATTLGYVQAARVADSSVPAFPLGLPAQMAIASAVFGERAVFYVPLVMGVVLVAASYWIALRMTRDQTTALAAAAAVSVHPVVFAYAIQAMSDVPATAWFLLAGALLMAERASFAALAGVSASAALITRPALVPGVLALSLIPAFCGEQRRARLAVYAGLVAAGIGIQGWTQSYLYGSPLANGYGPAEELFSTRFAWPNIRSYVYWVVMMHGVIWIVALGRGLFAVRDRPTRALLLASLAGALVPYVVYRTYDHWETLRFVLPLLVVLTVVAVAGAFQMAGRWAPPQVAMWLGVGLTLAMAAMWARWLEHERVFGLARVEERYARAGELVARATPQNAVVLSSLHSGSLRYYSKRQTVDWARIPPDALDRTVAALESHGHRVYLMFDGQQEQHLFEARHGNVVDRGHWLPAGQRRDLRLYEAPH
jgi:hypothetical protein